MSITVEPRTMTAEEYRRSVNDGRVTELVRGRIVEMNRPFTSHGYYCCQIAVILSQFVRQHELGRIVTNDAGVVTQ